jgi:hypothetical protein
MNRGYRLEGGLLAVSTRSWRIAAWDQGPIFPGLVQMSVGSHIHTPGIAKGQTYLPPPPGFSGSRLLLDSFQRLDNNLRWDSANALGAL